MILRYLSETHCRPVFQSLQNDLACKEYRCICGDLEDVGEDQSSFTSHARRWKRWEEEVTLLKVEPMSFVYGGRAWPFGY